MLLPVYTLAALLNIFAKNHNYNFNASKSLPYDIRMKRDLANENHNYNDYFNPRKTVFKGVELNEDVSSMNDKAEEPRDSVTNTIEVESSKYYLNNIDGNNNVPQDLDNEYYLDINGERFNEGKTQSNFKHDGTNENDVESKSNYIPDTIEMYSNVPEKVAKAIKVATPLNKVHKQYKFTDLYKRIKRNVKGNGYNKNQYGYNYNNQNDYTGSNHHGNDNNRLQKNETYYNFHVTEKTTMGKAMNWFKDMINPHQKYMITEYPAQNNVLNAPYTAYNGEITTVSSKPYKNWNDASDVNSNAYNNIQQNGYTLYDNVPKTNFDQSGQTLNENANNGYNYNNQQYSPNNDYRYAMPESNKQKSYSDSNTGYNSRDGNSYNGYNNNGNGYNNYSPFKVPDTTEAYSEHDVSTTEVLEGCVFCSHFGCPIGTIRRGVRCVAQKNKT